MKKLVLFSDISEKVEEEEEEDEERRVHIDIAIDEEKYEQVDESELNVLVSSEEKRSQFDILVYNDEETTRELSKVHLSAGN